MPVYDPSDAFPGVSFKRWLSFYGPQTPLRGWYLFITEDERFPESQSYGTCLMHLLISPCPMDFLVDFRNCWVKESRHHAYS